MQNRLKDIQQQQQQQQEFSAQQYNELHQQVSFAIVLGLFCYFMKSLLPLYWVSFSITLGLFRHCTWVSFAIVFGSLLPLYLGLFRHCIWVSFAIQGQHYNELYQQTIDSKC